MEVRDTLLLACGTAENRAQLRTLFEKNFNLLEADNIKQAHLLLEQNHSCISALLLDVTCPDKGEFSDLEEMSVLLTSTRIPAIVITEEGNNDQIIKAYSMGAIDAISQHCEPYALQQRVQNMVELYRHRWNLEELVREQADDLRRSNEAIIDTLSSIIEYRSIESGQHILRVRRFTQALLEEVARFCPEYALTQDTIAVISSAAALHDVGKISIPDSILNKPGKLTAEEYDIMKGHSLTGCHILEHLETLVSQDYLVYAHNICHYHHERWDGRGYPEGLSGSDIPLCAQVVGLADAYDALTSKRVYKDAFSLEKSRNMILNGECGVFSPKLLECFLAVTPQFEALATAYADGTVLPSEAFSATLPQPQQKSSDLFQVSQEKFGALLHFMDAMVLEADIDTGLFHVHYNSDPNLAVFSSKHSFEEAEACLTQEIIVPEDVERLGLLLHGKVVAFLDQGLRRFQENFHVRSSFDGRPLLYSVTFLRLHTNDSRRFLVIWKRSAEAPVEESHPTQKVREDLGLLAGFLRYRNDQWFTLESAEHELANLLGYTAQEIQEKFNNHLLELIPQEARTSVLAEFHRQLAKGRDIEMSHPLLHKDGRQIWVLNKSRLIPNGGRGESIYGFVTDITQSQQEQQELKLSLHHYQAMMRQMGNILFTWNSNKDLLQVSKEWEEVFGYPPLRDNFIARLSTESHFHPEDISLFSKGLTALRQGVPQGTVEARVAKADGRYLWCRFWFMAVREEEGSFCDVIGTITNIDEEKRAAQALRERAEQDALTKLLNKNTTRRKTEEYLNSFPQGARCALLIIDLDNFKQVNDQYGHLFGDAVLTRAAREIRSLFRGHDLVGRIGGDEFMVLMQGTSDRPLVESRCQKLVETLQQVFCGEHYQCDITCSVGVSISPDHGTTYFDLFLRADQALYQSKGRGKNCYCLYGTQDDEAIPPNPGGTRSAVGGHIDSDEQPGLADQGLALYAFQRLYEAKDMNAAIHDILAMVGQQMNVSRVYVFENNADNTACCNTFEWCNEGVPPEIDALQNLSYVDDIPNYPASFDENGLFYCPEVAALPRNMREILEPQGIISMLHCAILDKGVFRGYVGFDECSKKRLWTKEQIEVLSVLSEVLSVFLLKHRAQEQFQRKAADLEAILDSQNAWVYVIDPDTCQLKFLNKKTRSLATEAQVGMRCHEALMNSPARCPGCPALGIREKQFESRIMQNDKFNLKVFTEASLIPWQEETACLLTCRGWNSGE